MDDKLAQLNTVIEKHRGQPGALIPVLHEAQDIYGYLSEEVQYQISQGLHLPLADVYGVVTFYALFTMQPKGERHISVCLGTACYVKGAGNLVSKIQEQLGIKIGEVTGDRKFSLDVTRCIGACGLAPVLSINKEVHGRLTPDQVGEILENHK